METIKNLLGALEVEIVQRKAELKLLTDAREKLQESLGMQSTKELKTNGNGATTKAPMYPEMDAMGRIVPVSRSPKAQPQPLPAAWAENLPEKVLAAVRGNAGKTCAELAGLMGNLEVKQLGSVLRGLVADSKLTTEGKTRGTRYFAAPLVP